MTSEKIQGKFIEKFKEIEGVNGFYDLVPYTDGNIGFSIKKDFGQVDTRNVSLISLYVSNKPEDPEGKRPIIIDVAYGEKRDEGVSIRAYDKTKISSPIDLTSRDDYYYDILSNKLFNKTKEISPLTLADEIYGQHIKPTEFIRGFWLRVKMVFWRIILNYVFKSLSILFHYLLFVITGDKYSYEPVMQEEISNNRIVGHRFKALIGHQKNREMKDVLEERTKFDFLGYKTSYWIIISYSIINLALYAYFEYENWKPPIVVTLLRSNFLTLIYVIVSLWLMEAVLPEILKFLIKHTAILSFNSTYKRIRI